MWCAISALLRSPSVLRPGATPGAYRSRAVLSSKRAPRDCSCTSRLGWPGACRETRQIRPLGRLDSASNQAFRTGPTMRCRRGFARLSSTAADCPAAPTYKQPASEAGGLRSQCLQNTTPRGRGGGRASTTSGAAEPGITVGS